MKKFLAKMTKDEKGQGLVEYALIIFLVSIVAIVGLQLLGVNVLATFNQIAGELPAGG